MEGIGTMVGCEGLGRRYGSGATAVDALRDVSLAVGRGELVAITGPSGSGKSTLMHLLAGLDRPSAGRVSLAGVDPAKLSDARLTRLRRDHVGFVFQAFNLLPTLSAAENVTLPLELAGRKADREWVDELLRTVGLDGRRGHRPAELSGGQQQRVAVARALAHRPSVVFADEPTGNLDSRSGAEVLELLRGAADAYGQTTIIVTHDLRAARIADRVLFIADGRLAGELDRPTEDGVLATLEAVAS